MNIKYCEIEHNGEKIVLVPTPKNNLNTDHLLDVKNLFKDKKVVLYEKSNRIDKITEASVKEETKKFIDIYLATTIDTIELKTL